MKWQLSETEKVKIKACLHSIEYPGGVGERLGALVKLDGYLNGDRQLAYGVCKVYYVTLIPLMFSICSAQGVEVEQSRLALRILSGIAKVCSKRHVLFLLNSDRFRCLSTHIDDANEELATLTCHLVTTLLKLEDSVKELFWEQHLHQVLRTALNTVLPNPRTSTTPYTHALLDLLTASTANVRHRQELYGSGYGLCSQLLQSTIDILSTGGWDLAEKLLLSVAMLVRENKLNQDDFRKDPKLAMLKTILTTWYPHATTPSTFKKAVHLLYSSLQHGNEGVHNLLREAIPTFTIDSNLNLFMGTLLSSLEALKRHHYDVDVVVKALAELDEGLSSNEAARSHKCYYFKHCHGAWSLCFLCLNNIDERIMYQACCLTSNLVRSNPMNQEVFLEMNGIETLGEVLSDYNLDIQLVGLQILDALRGDAQRMRQIGDPTIVDYLLKIIAQFPNVFKQIVENRAKATTPSPTSPTHPSVTTTLDPGPEDTAASNWENQITIVQYAISLIGDMVAHSPAVKSKVIDLPNESGLLHLLSTCYMYIHTFYSTPKVAGNGTAKESRTHPRAQTAPGRYTRSEASAFSEAPSPLKKLSSFFIKILLGVVDVTCRALSNTVRHSPEAQWNFFKNGGSEQILNYLNCLVTFSEGGHELEAWAKVRRSSASNTLKEITYPGNALSALQSGDDKASCAVSKLVYLCQNSWLVNPELVASLLLVLVNTVEANTAIQSAMCEHKVRLCLHYLASNPSHVVVNAALLLVSHLCFNNSANQRFFATPYIVQRLQSLTAISYLQLLRGASSPGGVSVPWATEHLHLLTPPQGTDTGSFFAFQTLAYGYVCLSNLLQLYPAVTAVVLSAQANISGEVSPWTKLLAQSLLLPCHPVQDAALSLLSNMVNGCSDDLKGLMSPQVIDTLVHLVVMDTSDDNTGGACQPSGGDTEAEIKWLGNKAFQLVVSMGQGSTKQIVSQLAAMTEAMESHQDLQHSCLKGDSKVALEYYKSCDHVDIYNTVVSYLPILNGMTYTSEVCRKASLACGTWDVLVGLLCKLNMGLDLCVCIVFIMSNMLAHCHSVDHTSYVQIVEGKTMDLVAKGVLLGYIEEPKADDDKNMLADYVGCIFQLISQLVLRTGSHQVGGKSCRHFLVSGTHPHLHQLAVREAARPTTPTGHEALSYILLLAEDENTHTPFITTPHVQKVLTDCLTEVLPPSATMLVKKYLVTSKQLSHTRT